MTEKGTSVLATLTASVMAEKKAEARKLSPVQSDALPNDTGLFLSNERLHDHAKGLRKFAAEALAIADGIDAMVGMGSSALTEKVDPLAVQKAVEAAADAKFANAEPLDFNAAFKAKQEEAKASVFPDADAPDKEDWVCPNHGKAIDKQSAKTGRKYVGCPDCNLFKR